MGTPASVLVMLFALLFIERLEFCSTTSIDTNVSCIKSEFKALVKFRQSLADRPNRLSSWVGENCCAWKGVGCSKRTGHVVKLDLRNPSSLYIDHDTFVNIDDVLANYTKTTCLGGEINPSLLNLKHLHYVDLSHNDFSGIQIPKFLGSLKSLRYLNLSCAGFGGKIPHHLGNLSGLQYLDLSMLGSHSDYELIVDSLRWASTFSSVKHLDLSGVKLGEATDWLHVFNNLPSLLVLNLAQCWLDSIPPLSHVNFTSLASLDLQSNRMDSIPLWLSNISGLTHLHLDWNYIQHVAPDTLGSLTSLTVLTISRNSFNTSMPDWLCKLSNLVYLDLSGNAFRGSILHCLGNITQLTFLGLSDNGFEGEVPNTMGNLCNLLLLDLSSNQFSGDVPSFLSCPSCCLQNNLKDLNLGNNKFSGCLPNQLGDFVNLEHIFLDSNAFSGPIPASIGRLSSLISLDINDNKLNGSIPSSLGQLSNLERLYIRNNSLDGMVSELHFAKLARLTKLQMSLNSLVFNLSSRWVPPFQLRLIGLASCKLGPQFPQWLQTQRHVDMLDISNASISGTIPDWFEDLYSRIDYLDLSYNQISGKLPEYQQSNKSERMFGRIILDLSNNFFSGPIPPIHDNRLTALVLSNNRLTGGVPMHLCMLNATLVIDLSNNQLSGRLPWCLGDLKGLSVLDLTNNNLNGDIPSSWGSLRWLSSLHLHNNRFHGQLPLSLQNLTALRILDLGENEFDDIIPPWIGEKLSALKFLSLQSNKFYGDIPPQLCHLSYLQLLNLAQNDITGYIPHCFSNFTAMVVDQTVVNGLDSFIYQNRILDPMKGRELEYYTSVLPFFISIDLSSNNIFGEIPDELMDLYGLRNLNVAGNHLKGRIPDKIGNLKQLENLDLSRNELSGPIPQSMSALNFLSHLNLSFNNLSGRIPHGNQLQTLDDPSIYMGNNEICGALLLKSCTGDKLPDGQAHVGENKGGDDSIFLWFYAGIGPGLLVGFLGVCSILHFKKSWRYAYFQLVDNVYNWLWVAIKVKAARLRRKFHKGEVRR